MTASGKEPTAPRESEAPAPRAESEGHRLAAARAEVEALRRRSAVMQAYLGIIG